MSCGAGVDPAAARCESCYSELDQDVKAFRCPKCGKLLELGAPECPKCSMRFKAKTVRPADREKDAQILSRLMDMEKAPAKEAAPGPPQPLLSAEEAEAVSGVVRRLSELAESRAELASGMEARDGEGKERVSRMRGSDAASISVDDLRSELSSVSEDMRRMAEALSKARELSAEVARTFSMPGPSKMAGGAEVSLGAPAAAEESLLEREEQVRKREEMVDRKIKAYAQKKKELEDAEARQSGAPGPPAAPAELGRLAARIRSVHEVVSADGASDDPEACLSSLEERVRDLVTSRSGLEQRVSQLEEGEQEVRSLLKVLDGLLGQLPPDVVDRFSKTDEFKLYERVLDRLRI